MSRDTSHRARQSRARMQALRDRRRAQGLRPVQHWVPDLRQAAVRKAIAQEAARLHLHPENHLIDDWIEAVADVDD